MSTSPPPVFSVSIAQPGPPGPPGAQSPWTQDIDAGEFNLTNLGTLSFIPGTAASITCQAGPELVITAMFQNFNADVLQFYSTAGHGRLYLGSNGAFTIYATEDASDAFTVNGVIASASGGIRFPDGSLQTSAALTTVAGSQTPWAQDIDAAGHSLNNVQDISITGDLYRDGVPLAVSSQTDQTANRALGAVYQNTTSKTLFVLVTLNLASKAADVSFRSDASNPPVMTITRVSDDSNAAVTNTLFAMVLPGNYYECVVNSGTPAVSIWIEYD